LACPEPPPPLLVLSAGAQILPVHIDAIGATIDLRGSKPYQVQQRFLQSAAMKIAFEAAQRSADAGGRLLENQCAVSSETSLH
jgi:hypothetical protein